MQASPAQQDTSLPLSETEADELKKKRDELMKKIIARMPSSKADVFAYPIAWAAYDGAA